MTRRVLILGSSRSGTTLLAKILAGSGVFMGADTESNHESRSLQAVNRWILQNAGGSLETASAFDRLYGDGFMCDAIQQVVDAHVKGPGSWRYWGWRLAWPPAAHGFKDPRTTYTLPFWLAAWPDARVIHVLRNGVDVAASLRARRRRVELRWRAGRGPLRAIVRQNRTVANLRADSLEHAFELWREYVDRATGWVEALGRQATTVRFEAVVDDPQAELERLSTFLQHRLRLSVAIDTARAGAGRGDEIARDLYDRRRATLAQYGY